MLSLEPISIWRGYVLSAGTANDYSIRQHGQNQKSSLRFGEFLQLARSDFLTPNATQHPFFFGIPGPETVLS